MYYPERNSTSLCGHKITLRKKQREVHIFERLRSKGFAKFMTTKTLSVMGNVIKLSQMPEFKSSLKS